MTLHRRHQGVDFVIVLAAALLLGAAAGYLSYMRGIQRGDPILALSWFVFIPLLVFLQGGVVPRRHLRGLGLSVVGSLAYSFAVLLGFWSVYTYDDMWRAGGPCALLSAVEGVALIVVASWPRMRMSRLLAIPGRVVKAVQWVSLIASAALVIVLASLRMPYEAQNELGFFGEGILNLAADDFSASTYDGGLRAAMFDTKEGPRFPSSTRERAKYSWASSGTTPRTEARS